MPDSKVPDGQTNPPRELDRRWKMRTFTETAGTSDNAQVAPRKLTQPPWASPGYVPAADRSLLRQRVGGAGARAANPLAATSRGRGYRAGPFVGAALGPGVDFEPALA
jgi:hypothetical protein